MEKRAVIIPAAGSGVRLGSDVAKPFIKLQGKTILQRSIECFTGLPDLSQVIVATSEGYIEECEQIFSNIEHPAISFEVTEGGEERQYSILKALSKLNDDIGLVAIHDAVRPFVNPRHIEECFEAALKYGGAILAVPAKDTIKKAGNDKVIMSTPDRNFLWQAQTPQVFKKTIIEEAYSKALSDNFLGTDDSSLVEHSGGFVKIVEGDRKNLKITYPIDLKIAEFILQEEQ